MTDDELFNSSEGEDFIAPSTSGGDILPTESINRDTSEVEAGELLPKEPVSAKEFYNFVESNIAIQLPILHKFPDDPRNRKYMGKSFINYQELFSTGAAPDVPFLADIQIRLQDCSPGPSSHGGVHFLITPIIELSFDEDPPQWYDAATSFENPLPEGYQLARRIHTF